LIIKGRRNWGKAITAECRKREEKKKVQGENKKSAMQVFLNSGRGGTRVRRGNAFFKLRAAAKRVKSAKEKRSHRVADEGAPPSAAQLNL